MKICELCKKEIDPKESTNLFTIKSFRIGSGAMRKEPHYCLRNLEVHEFHPLWLVFTTCSICKAYYSTPEGPISSEIKNRYEIQRAMRCGELFKYYDFITNSKNFNFMKNNKKFLKKLSDDELQVFLTLKNIFVDISLIKKFLKEYQGNITC